MAACAWRNPRPRHLVVNADEGEPGTFKDRHCLETDPHRVLEGMLLAAMAVGAEACWFYLRDEYPWLRHMLERGIAALEAAGLLPMPVPSAARRRRLYLRRGDGAAGKPGRPPRLSAPQAALPGQAGLFGRPTLIHNVETLSVAAEILARRRVPLRYAAEGRRGRSGQRFFSVSGRVREPGVKLAPAGSARGN